MESELGLLLPTFIFIAGAMLGSFANVIILRWPKGESFVFPNSRCPKCKSAIKFYDNIPIFSWIFLKGKCRKCHKKISIRYPVIELLMATLFLFIYVKTGFKFTLIEYLIFAFGLVVCSIIDFENFLLPDLFTISGIVIGLIGSYLNPDRTFLDSFFGVLFGGGFLWSIAVVYQLLRKEEGVGGGDIKLLAWMGAVLGWKAIPFIILFSSIIGTIFGLILAGKARKGLKTVIPFGLYLSIAALVYIFGGHDIGQWYLSLFIPEL